MAIKLLFCKFWVAGRLVRFANVLFAGLLFLVRARGDKINNALAKIMRLFECSFVEKGENILITGSTGVGKSSIATALGYQSCIEGYRVVYYNVDRLFAKLKMTRADGSYLKEIARLERQHLLILDDFGLQPLDNQNRMTLLEIIEDRHGKGSVIITSQLPVSGWYDIIGEKTVADAILDRLVHDAHRIELMGESMRKTRNKAYSNMEEISN